MVVVVMGISTPMSSTFGGERKGAPGIPGKWEMNVHIKKNVYQSS